MEKVNKMTAHKRTRKGTILYTNIRSIMYHFYYDYDKKKYSLITANLDSRQEFYKRIGKILEGCPLSDVEIRTVKKGSNKPGEIVKPKCGHFKQKK